MKISSLTSSLEETTDSNINDLFLTTDKLHNFGENELKQVLVFAVCESFFVLNNKYYHQIHSIAIVFPLNPQFLIYLHVITINIESQIILLVFKLRFFRHMFMITITITTNTSLTFEIEHKVYFRL